MRQVTVLFLVGVFGVSACSEPASIQRIEVAVDGHGYEPSTLDVQAGQDVVLAFTRTTDEGCGQVLVVPSLDIRRDPPLNETVEIQLPAQQADANIRFTCGMNMLEGVVVVQ